VYGVLVVKGAVFLQFQAARGAPFVFSGGVITIFALSALHLNDIARHGAPLLSPQSQA
jgi:hypothetical protein